MKRIRIALPGPEGVPTSIWVNIEEKDGSTILHLLNDYPTLKIQPGQQISARGLQLQVVGASGRDVTCTKKEPVAAPPESTSSEESI